MSCDPVPSVFQRPFTGLAGSASGTALRSEPRPPLNRITADAPSFARTVSPLSRLISGAAGRHSLAPRVLTSTAPPSSLLSVIMPATLPVWAARTALSIVPAALPRRRSCQVPPSPAGLMAPDRRVGEPTPIIGRPPSTTATSPRSLPSSAVADGRRLAAQRGPPGPRRTRRARRP